MKELNKIYNEDCLIGMKDIPDNSIDLLVTDPPYKTISGGVMKDTSIGGYGISVLKKNDGKIFEHNDINIHDYLVECFRVLKEGGHAYIMTNVLNLFDLHREALRVGFKLHNLLVWEKNNANASRWYMKNCEYTLFLRKGNAKRINNASSKTVHKFNNVLKTKNHPTEKPVELMEFYITNSSNQGDVVLDPFMGSGTTAVACLNTGRNFIGFELDENYYKKSLERIEKEKSAV